MAASNCPRCGTEMVSVSHGALALTQCPEGHGVFLDRADLGTLIEAETDWHRNATHDTARLPRITADMTEPPAPLRPRAWVETLFS
ncbi:zf-TFIIB domain-containing protein [Nocardioides speluncae]|uniref:TFIIB-type zinc ribbon-containing protein n=1 Tax=Nocardioides speluncae TaxID=2670337 RepID=UPI000D693D5C|nr:zf-TFIIB domain-containing protein [Nocardioides speluncae]